MQDLKKRKAVPMYGLLNTYNVSVCCWENLFGLWSEYKSPIRMFSVYTVQGHPVVQ